MMKKLCVVTGLVVIVSACSSTSPKKEPGNPHGLLGKVIASSVYQCGDVSAVATFTDQEELLLERGKDIKLLKQEISASGAKYGGGQAAPGLVFWSKGDTAFLEDGGKSRDCREVNNLLPVQIHGNEPGWHVAFDQDITRVNLRYGQIKLDLPTAKIERDGRRWRYTASDSNNTVTAQLDNAMCVDSMSGMTYPMKATLTMGEQSYSGCGGNPALTLAGPAWTVTHINGVAAQGDATLQFDTSDQLFGSTGCNRFSTKYELTGEGMRIARAATTRMACSPALMQQETQFLKVLGSVYQFAIPKKDILVLQGDRGQEIRARRQ